MRVPKMDKRRTSRKSERVGPGWKVQCRMGEGGRPLLVKVPDIWRALEP